MHGSKKVLGNLPYNGRDMGGERLTERARVLPSRNLEEWLMSPICVSSVGELRLFNKQIPTAEVPPRIMLPYILRGLDFCGSETAYCGEDGPASRVSSRVISSMSLRRTRSGSTMTFLIWLWEGYGPLTRRGRLRISAQPFNHGWGYSSHAV